MTSLMTLPGFEMLLMSAALFASFFLGCVVRMVQALGGYRADAERATVELSTLLERFEEQGGTVARQQEELDRIQQRLEAARTRSSSRSSRGSRDARDLARAGAGIDTLMRQCALSRSEAELVIACQRRSDA